MTQTYTAGEAAWLLGLTREEAVDLDTGHSSWREATREPSELPVLVRRGEVHAAARRVARRDLERGRGRREVGETLAVLALRGAGARLDDVAAALRVPRSTVARRFSEGLAAVLDGLEWDRTGPE